MAQISREMDAIAAAYGSSSSASEDSSGSNSDTAAPPSRPEGTDQNAGAKRKREHEGSRPQWKRVFPHVDGQWPSHVRIGIPLDEPVRRHVDGIIAGARKIVGEEVAVIPIVDEDVGELHLSLSRPFVLTHDQIRPFVDALRSALKWRKW